MLALFKMIPIRTWVYIALVVVTLIGVDRVLVGVFNAGVNHEKLLQDERNRKERDKNDAEKQHIEQQAAERLARVNSDVDRARAVSNGLQRQLDDIKRIARDAAGPLAPGTSARDAVVLLADLLQQCSERYTRVAKFADTAHAAGAACEQSYDSLKKNPR